MDDSAGAGIFALLFAGCNLLFLCIGLLLSIAAIWLFIACLIDVSRKSETEFKDRTLWLVILILGFFIPFGFIAPIVYYFKYKPNLYFWK